MDNYICNITGDKFILEDKDKTREGGHFNGFNCRFRAICYVLSKLLLDKICVLMKIPIMKDKKGLGINDGLWSSILEEKFDYNNLSVTDFSSNFNFYDSNFCEENGNQDFIICSEILNHVSPSPGIQTIFDNFYSMLNDNGFLIFSVPFGYGKHVEHFPSLHKYIIKEVNGEKVLLNISKTEKKEKFSKLTFYNPEDNNSLEMRIFSSNSIREYLTKAGFEDITFHSPKQDFKMKKCGIFWENECSLIVSARKIL